MQVGAPIERLLGSVHENCEQFEHILFACLKSLLTDEANSSPAPTPHAPPQ